MHLKWYTMIRLMIRQASVSQAAQSILSRATTGYWVCVSCRTAPAPAEDRDLPVGSIGTEDGGGCPSAERRGWKEVKPLEDDVPKTEPLFLAGVTDGIYMIIYMDINGTSSAEATVSLRERSTSRLCRLKQRARRARHISSLETHWICVKHQTSPELPESSKVS